MTFLRSFREHWMEHFLGTNTTNSRKALFHLINEMCDEMRKKLDNDWDHIVIDRWTVGWQILKENDDEDTLKSPSGGKVYLKKSDEADHTGSFSFYCKVGFMFGVTSLRIETSHEKYKDIKILELHS